MIQYAATFMSNHRRHGILDRPVKPGDDGCAMGDDGCAMGDDRSAVDSA
jgi:hypothetical protein